MNDPPGRAERAGTVVVLLALTRTPLLFLRQRTADLAGGPVGQFWQDDPLLRTAFFVVELALVAFLLRRAVELRRWWLAPLAVFLAFAVVSVGWSVEPSVTQVRALQFSLTAGAGLYLAVRYTLREQVLLVTAAIAAGAVLSVMAALAWPEFATRTNGVGGIWSGIFVNRNLLGASMALGLLGLALAWFLVSARLRLAVAAAAALELSLLIKSGSRTGVLVLGVCAGVALVVWVLRRLAGSRLDVRTAGLATAGVTATGALVVRAAWPVVLDVLGRESTLSRRTVMWTIDRALWEVRPMRGYGFEAIWADPPIVEDIARQFGNYPYQAHSGYLELLLGVGVVGVVLFGAWVAVVLARTFARAWAGTSAVELWPLLLAAFVLAINLSEGFFVPNELLWALFVAAGANGIGRSANAGTFRPAPVPTAA